MKLVERDRFLDRVRLLEAGLRPRPWVEGPLGRLWVEVGWVVLCIALLFLAQPQDYKVSLSQFSRLKYLLRENSNQN